MAYLDTPFKGSISQNNIMGAAEYQLKNARPYYEIAITYHSEKGNDSQVEFFREGLALTDKRLTLFAADAARDLHHMSFDRVNLAAEQPRR